MSTKYLFLPFFLGVFLCIPQSAFAFTLITDKTTYTPGETVFFSDSNGFNYLFLYRDGDLSAPVCYSDPLTNGNVQGNCTNGGSYSGTVQDSYHFIQGYNAGCQTSDYATCLSDNPDIGTLAEFTVGTPTPPPGDQIIFGNDHSVFLPSLGAPYNVIQKYYGSGYEGSFNQISYYANGIEANKTTGAGFTIFDGIATTSYSGYPYYWGINDNYSVSNGFFTTCIVNSTDGATTTVAINSSDIISSSSWGSYNQNFYTGGIYGNSSKEMSYFVLSYNTDCGAPITPDNGLFNEVDHYIPSVGVATTTGTTTVGAVFSINKPEFIDYIGYKIISPNNEIVYNATTSVSFTALYTLSTDYNFNTNGIYTGHAYFTQNGWETDNPTIQQIAINVVDWTVNPDGTFTQNPATTSTTTLPNLSLDCGTGFAGSICNLTAKLLLPDPSAIQNVQANWGLLMNNAPFSFFTQSKALLGALRGTVGQPQTLSVIFFGKTTQIISASTTASIGFGAVYLSFAKLIMSVGLWIMFAWFIYWRVGTIFHPV